MIGKFVLVRIEFFFAGRDAGLRKCQRWLFHDNWLVLHFVRRRNCSSDLLDFLKKLLIQF